jgi:hypothetical protein
MAVTATFKADFASFYAAVEKAEVKLGDMEKGAAKAQSSLNRMVDSFSGRKTIQEAALMVKAIGGVENISKLTDAELKRVSATVGEAAAKMKALGKDVPESFASILKATQDAGSGWAKFVAGFDVKTAIADPMGTAKSAVTALASSFTPLGVAAAAATTVLGAMSVAAFKLVSSVAAAGGKLDDLSDATGISVPVLSRWSAAATVMGRDVSQLTNAVFKMQIGMGESSAKFESGLKKIGLSMADLKALEPDQQLERISAALVKVTDKAVENAAGTAIFGKQYRELAPVVRDFGQALDLVGDVDVWTAEQAADAERFEMQMASLKVHISDLATAIGRWLIPAANLLAKALADGVPWLVKWVGELTGISPLLRAVGAAWDYGSAALERFNLKASSVPTIAGPAEKAMGRWRAQIDGMGIAVPSLDDAMGEWNRTTKQATDLGRAAAATMEDGGKAAKAQADQLKKTTDQIVLQVRAYEQNIEVNKRFWGDIHQLAKNTGDKIIANWRSLQAFLNKPLEGTGGVGDLMKTATDQWLKDIKAAGPSLKTQFKDLFSSLPQTLISAFTGGGGVGGAIKAIGSQIGSLIGSAFGPIGSSVGSLLGPAISGIGKLFGLGESAADKARKAAKAALEETQRLSREFIEIGGGYAAMEAKAAIAGATLERVMNARTPEAYKQAIDDLNDALAFQDDTMKFLEETAKKYGFTISELGPRFAAQQLTQQVSGLIKEYTALTAAGVDHTAIINRMGPALLEYVKAAADAGVAIPEQMRPILESMERQGLLVDENGNALVDISKLTWSQDLTKQIEGLIQSLNRMVEAIERGLNPALKNIPHPPAPWADWGAPPTVPNGGFFGGGGSDDSASYGSTGGVVTPDGIQYRASGGMIWPRRGSDTVPAMLTPGERVLNVRENKAYEAGATMNTAAMEGKLDELRAELANQRRSLPRAIRDAMLLAG